MTSEVNDWIVKVKNEGGEEIVYLHWQSETSYGLTPWAG